MSATSGTLHHPLGLVRILQNGERPVGLGFLVRGNFVLTAAHVINAALERDKDTQDEPALRPVYVEFCLLEPAAIVRRARVSKWIKGDSPTMDLAALALDEAPPQGVDPIPLAKHSASGDVMLFGPIANQSTGGWGFGEVRELVESGLLQIQQRQDGIFRAEVGWSGGPIWSHTDRSVVGMVVSRPESDDGRTDVYAIPVGVLERFIPDVKLAIQSNPAPRLGAEDEVESGSSVAGLTRTVNGIFNRLDRIERLAILPNYKLPSTSGVRKMDELPENLAGARILLKLDLDVPGRPGHAGVNFKFARAAKTIQAVASRGGSAMILYGQGFSSVDRLEITASAPDSEWQRTQLASVLDPRIRLRSVKDAAEVISYPPETPTFSILPDIHAAFPEDRAFYDLGRLPTQSIDELCSNSPLVRSLNEHFDIFILDDFRSTVFQLPSNVGLAGGKHCVIGRGMEGDLISLEGLVGRCIALGRQANSRRYCIAGSSRPDSIRVVETFLERRLFDRVMLGVFPALLVLAANKEVSLSPSITVDLEVLAEKSGESLASLLRSSATRLADDHLDRLGIPTDFIVGSAKGHGSLGPIRTISVPELESVGENERVMGIGAETVANFKSWLDRGELVFHFGMLGASSGPARHQTEEIIDHYCKIVPEVYLAGDHILDIATELGHSQKLAGAVTGAYTTSNYMTGIELPGLAPFTVTDRRR